nr:MAG TPA: hypothetical protein [Caudoviricetes sp.]
MKTLFSSLSVKRYWCNYNTITQNSCQHIEL